MAIDQRDISSSLRFMDDRALQQYAAMHKNDPYIFPLAFQESQNRQKLRMSQQSAQGMQPQPKVADQALAQMAPPQAQPMPEEMGIGALPAGNMEGMADGGIVGYEGYDESGVPNTFGEGPVRMMAEGGHVPRYQGNSQDRSLVRLPYGPATGGVAGDIPGYAPSATQFMPQAGAPEELPFFQRQLAAAREQGMQYQLSQAQARISQGRGTAPDFALVAEAQRKADASAPPTRRADYETTSPALTGDTTPKVDAAPKADTRRKDTGRNTPAAAAATDTPAKTDTGGLDALVSKLTRDTELAQGALQNRRVGFASQLEKEATDEAEATKKRIKEEGDVFAGKEARLAAREKGIEGMGDKYMGLALLQAGAAMMSTPGNLGSVIGKGIAVGSERYIAGIDKINAAKDKFAEARDRLDDLRLNRDDMNKKEVRDAERAVRTSRIQGQQLLMDGATNDLKMTTDNMREYFRAGAEDLKTDKTIKAERENVLTRERGANARAAMPTGADRTAMMLGTGKTDAERLESGMVRLQQITADKSGMAAVKVLADINAKRMPGEPAVTMDDLLKGAREFSSLMYGPKVADVAPNRARP
jgi:hypothetical protein